MNFIVYQYKRWTNMLNLDQVVKIAKSTDDNGEFVLHIYTTNSDMFLFGTEAEDFWNAFSMRHNVVQVR